MRPPRTSVHFSDGVFISRLTPLLFCYLLLPDLIFIFLFFLLLSLLSSLIIVRDVMATHEIIGEHCKDTKSFVKRGDLYSDVSVGEGNLCYCCYFCEIEEDEDTDGERNYSFVPLLLLLLSLLLLLLFFCENSRDVV